MFPIQSQRLVRHRQPRPNRLGGCGAAQRSTLAADQTQRSFAQYRDRRQLSSECVHFTVPRALGDSFVLRATYCAFIQVSEPVSLTDTSERKICRGLTSAVPRCSVEISRGPAFL